jgi:hypothetical protein
LATVIIRILSAAGDVNGDGLDDLIVGAHKADSNSNKLDSGKSIQAIAIDITCVGD